MRCFPQVRLHFFRRTNEQSIADSCVRRVNRSRSYFEHAGASRPDWRNAEGTEVLDHVNHAVGFVKINQIDREEHAECVDAE